MEMKKIIFAFIVVAALMSSVMATDPKPAAGGAAAGGATAGGAAAGGAAAAVGGAAPAPSTGGSAPAPGPASAAVSDALPAMRPLLGATFVTLFAYYFQ